MNVLKNILCLFVVFSVSGCSFVYELLVQNLSKSKAEVIYSPLLPLSYINNKTPEAVNYKNGKSFRITLDPAETIKIGRVQNKEQPDAASVEIDYLEIRSSKDTLTLNNKSTIVGALQKVDKYDWRLLIK